MKKSIVLTMALVLVLALAGLAEGMDLSGYTDEQLADLSERIAQEREARTTEQAAQEDTAVEVDAAVEPVEATGEPQTVTLTVGQRGEEVRALQRKLNELGYNCGAADGAFGAKTQAALVALQSALGLEATGSVEVGQPLDAILALEKGDGVNLLVDTDYHIERDSTSDTIERKAFVPGEDFDLQSLIGKTVTMSFYVSAPGERGTCVEDVDGSDGYMADRFGGQLCVIWADSTDAQEAKKIYPCTSQLCPSVEDARVFESYTFVAPEGYDTLEYVDVSIQCGARPAEGNAAVWSLGYPKLELGSFATEWTAD